VICRSAAHHGASKNGWAFINKGGGWEFTAFFLVRFQLGDDARTLMPLPSTSSLLSAFGWLIVSPLSPA